MNETSTLLKKTPQLMSERRLEHARILTDLHVRMVVSHPEWTYDKRAELALVLVPQMLAHIEFLEQYIFELQSSMHKAGFLGIVAERMDEDA
jgi:hypothetical protein